MADTQLCAYLNVPTVIPAYSALITNISTIQLRAPRAARGREGQGREERREREKREREKREREKREREKREREEVGV